MKATVEVGEEDVQESYESKPAGMFRKAETTTFNHHHYTVTTVLELTEEERAIIKRYDLSQELLDDYPEFTEREVQAARQSSDSRNENLRLKDEVARQIAQQISQDASEMMRARRIETTVSALLEVPFKRRFNHAAKAALYSQRMKTKILPDLSKLVKQFTNISPSETLEF